MPSVSYTDAAKADLEDIVAYTLETWGGDQATTYIDALETLAASLADTPMIGKACEDLHAELRAYLFESHVIYYVIDANGIVVVRVLHQSMDSTLQFAGN